jgi:hypothetical protein
MYYLNIYYIIHNLNIFNLIYNNHMITFTSLQSFLFCTYVHLLFTGFQSQVRDSSNLLTCVTFQSLFSISSGYVSLYSSLYLNIQNYSLLVGYSNTILDILAGYFLYDTLYLLLYKFSLLYFGHHLISFIAIQLIKTNVIPYDIVPYYPLLCFVLEVTNPFLNIRPFTKGTQYYKLNVYYIFITFLLFRVILFPYVAISIISRLDSQIIWGIFFIIYGVSLFWFKKIINLTTTTFHLE